MLYRRLISSAVVITLILLILWADFRIGAATARNGVLIAVVVSLAALGCAEEFRQLASGQFRLPRALVLLTMAISLVLCCMPLTSAVDSEIEQVAQLGWMALAYAAALFVPLLYMVSVYAPGEQSLLRLALIFLMCGYILSLGFICQLRFGLPNAWGVVAILSLFVTVKASDSFAYLIGRAWGRRKMSPRLSPGKTIEGGVAALVFGCLGAVVVFYPVSWWIAGKVAVHSLWMALAFGLVVTVVGILGDLGESLVKRELGRKDSGGLIPGMGGLLDVVDSIVAAAPVVYLFWNAGWVGPR